MDQSPVSKMDQTTVMHVPRAQPPDLYLDLFVSAGRCWKKGRLFPGAAWLQGFGVHEDL